MKTSPTVGRRAPVRQFGLSGSTAGGLGWAPPRVAESPPFSLCDAVLAACGASWQIVKRPGSCSLPGGRLRVNHETAALSLQLYTNRRGARATHASGLRRRAAGRVSTRGVVRHGRRADEYARLLPDAGLVAPSAHTSIVGGELNQILDAAARLGVSTVIEPAVHADRWSSRSDVLGHCRRAQYAAETASGTGVAIGYHNHRWESRVQLRRHDRLRPVFTRPPVGRSRTRDDRRPLACPRLHCWSASAIGSGLIHVRSRGTTLRRRQRTDARARHSCCGTLRDSSGGARRLRRRRLRRLSRTASPFPTANGERRDLVRPGPRWRHRRRNISTQYLDNLTTFP